MKPAWIVLGLLVWANAAASTVYAATLPDGLVPGTEDGASPAVLELRSSNPPDLVADILAGLAPDLADAIPRHAFDLSLPNRLIPWRHIDPARPHHTEHISQDTTWNAANGPHLLDHDVVVEGTATLTVDNTRVEFDADHFIKIEYGASLVVQGDDAAFSVTYDDLLAPAVILAFGAVSITGSEGHLIEFKNVALAAYKPRGQPPKDVDIDYASFRDGSLGIAAGHKEVHVTHSSFANLGVGIDVLDAEREGNQWIYNDPLFENVQFVGNYFGYHLAKARPAMGNREYLGGLGELRNAVFEGNAFGIQCESAGTDPLAALEDHPIIRHVNFNHDMAEGYAGVYGGHVDGPPVGSAAGDIDVGSSRCDLEEVSWGTDSMYWGKDDTQPAETQEAAYDDIDAPDGPYTVRVIDADQNWPNNTPLTQPVVVAPGKTLTLDGINIDQKGFLLGAAKGRTINPVTGLEEFKAGALHLSNVQITDPAIVLRNSDPDPVAGTRGDSATDLHMEGDARFLAGITQWRNDKVVKGMDAHDIRGAVYFASGGILLDPAENTWKSHILKSANLPCTASRIGIFVMQVNMDGPTGGGKIEECTVRDASIVAVSIHGALELTQNNVRGFIGGAFSIGLVTGKMTSTDNKWESGGAAYVSALSTAITYTRDLVAASRLGVVSGLDLAPLPTVTDSNVTFNGIGLSALGSNIQVKGSTPAKGTNVIHNYLLGYYTVDIEFEGAPSVPANIDCSANACRSPDDEGEEANFLGGNPSHNGYIANLATPSWGGSNEHIVDGTGASGPATLAISGVLDRPAIARKGGTLSVKDVDLDGQGRFPIGIKTGHPDFDPGKLDVQSANLNGVRFIGAGSNDVSFRDSSVTGRFGIVARGAPPSVECVRFANSFAPLTLSDADAGAELVFRRNVLGASDEAPPSKISLDTLPMTVGLSLGIQQGETTDATIENNLVEGGARLLTRYGDGHIVASNNNLDPESAVAEEWRGSEQADQDPLHLRGNWWGDATGPTIVAPDTSINPNGKGAHLIYNSEAKHMADPDVEDVAAGEEFLDSAIALSPCAGIRLPTGTVDDAHDVQLSAKGLSLIPERPITAWAWDLDNDGAFDDGDTSTVSYRFHNDAANGNQPSRIAVKATVALANGQSVEGTGERTLSVANAPPVAAFHTIPAKPTAGVEMQFKDDSSDSSRDGSVVGWTWEVDGATISEEREPFHTFAEARAYTVELTAEDNNGAQTITSQTVNVNAKPTASFSVQPANPTVNEDVTFDGSASSDPESPTDSLSFAWDFGDGTTASGQIVHHAFESSGAKDVKLVVTDPDGGEGETRQEVPVNNPPTADFSWDPIVPDEGELVSFASTSSDTDGSIDPASLAWNFGDDAAAEGESAQHAFADGGRSYHVTFTVEDDQGAPFTAAHDVRVNALPVVSFHTDPNPRPGVPVNFHDDTQDAEGPVASWLWHFGDGATSTDQNPSHVYEVAAHYDVTLEVTDSDQAHVDHIEEIVVNDPPAAAFSHAPLVPQVGELVQFRDASSDDLGIESWSWAFGDGASGSGPNPTHAYASGGDKIVTLTVTDTDDEEASVQHTLHVNIPPVASFTYTPDPASPNEEIDFFDGSADQDGNVVAWSWDFDGLGSSDLQNPSFTFADSGTYDVSLTVTDNDERSTTVTQKVFVQNEPPVVAFTADLGEKTVAFDASESEDPEGQPLSYSWNFGDGSPSGSGVTVSHAYALAGEYDVTLTVSDGVHAPLVTEHIVATCTANLNVAEGFEGMALGDPNPGCWYEIDLGGHNVGNWQQRPTQWEVYSTEDDAHCKAHGGSQAVAMDDDCVWGNGYASEEKDSLYSPFYDLSELSASDGVKLQYWHINSMGVDWDPQACVHVEVRDTIAGDWVELASVCGRDNLWAQASIDLDNYKGEPFVQVRYRFLSEYTNGNTEWGIFLDDVKVSVTDTAPAADFTYAPAAPRAGASVAFTDQSSDPNGDEADGTIESWSWDFDDGTSSTERNPSHTFADGGAYHVTLTVIDNEGFEGQTSQDVTVDGTPRAAFNVSPASPFAFESVSFTDESTDPDGAVVSWEWDFGDGAASDEQNPRHAYNEPGQVTVTLTVHDDEGQSDTEARTVTVRGAPTADFSYEPAQPIKNEPVHFTDESTDEDGEIASWLWDFGDGATSIEQNPSHAYAAGGDFVVQLTARDNHGFEDSKEETIHVCDPDLALPPGPIHIGFCGSGSIPIDSPDDGPEASVVRRPLSDLIQDDPEPAPAEEPAPTDATAIEANQVAGDGGTQPTASDEAATSEEAPAEQQLVDLPIEEAAVSVTSSEEPSESGDLSASDPMLTPTILGVP